MRRVLGGFLAVGLVGLSACSGDEPSPAPPDPSAAHQQRRLDQRAPRDQRQANRRQPRNACAIGIGFSGSS
jgi:hypothetical protein